MGDDDVFRGALAANLQDDGHTVFEYTRRSEFPPLVTLGTRMVVVADYEPPEGGLEFVERLHVAYPTVPIIVVTADLLPPPPAAWACARLLYKPFGYDELHRVLHQLLADNA